MALMMRRSSSLRGKAMHSQTARKMLLGVLGALMVGNGLGCMLPVRISGYRGEGRITRVPFLLNPGFQVDFEQFPASDAHKASYKLNGIPKHDDTYRVGIVLLVPDADLNDRPRFGAGSRVLKQRFGHSRWLSDLRAAIGCGGVSHGGGAR